MAAYLRSLLRHVFTYNFAFSILGFPQTDLAAERLRSRARATSQLRSRVSGPLSC